MRLLSLTLLLPGVVSFLAPPQITFTPEHAARGVADLLQKEQHKGCILTSDEHLDQKRLVKSVALYLRTHSTLSKALRLRPNVLHLTNLDSEFGLSLDQVSDTVHECPDVLVFADFGDRDWISAGILPEFMYHIHVTSKEPRSVIVKCRSPLDM